MRRRVVVYGSSTDVGKTLCSLGLMGAGLRRGGAAYLKPVQTGSPRDADVIATYFPKARTATLYAYRDPVSPHIAAGANPPTNLKNDIITWLHAATEDLVVVESAGGVRFPVSLRSFWIFGFSEDFSSCSHIVFYKKSLRRSSPRRRTEVCKRTTIRPSTPSSSGILDSVVFQRPSRLRRPSTDGGIHPRHTSSSGIITSGTRNFSNPTSLHFPSSLSRRRPPSRNPLPTGSTQPVPSSTKFFPVSPIFGSERWFTSAESTTYRITR